MSEATVLLVEDEEYIRENLSEILEMNGYRVTTAANGEAGLDAMKDAPADIVLTDLNLPGIILKNRSARTNCSSP